MRQFSTMPTIFWPSSDIMAYQDDKAMTKMGRNVHAPVISDYPDKLRFSQNFSFDQLW